MLSSQVLPPTKTNLATLFFARQVRTWVVKHATSLFNSFRSKATKQVAGFSFARLTVPIASQTENVIYAIFKTRQQIEED